MFTTYLTLVGEKLAKSANEFLTVIIDGRRSLRVESQWNCPRRRGVEAPSDRIKRGPGRKKPVTVLLLTCHCADGYIKYLQLDIIPILPLVQDEFQHKTDQISSVEVATFAVVLDRSPILLIPS